MSVQFKAFPEKWDWDSVLEHVIVHYRLVRFLKPIDTWDLFHWLGKVRLVENASKISDSDTFSKVFCTVNRLNSAIGIFRAKQK